MDKLPDFSKDDFSPGDFSTDALAVDESPLDFSQIYKAYGQSLAARLVTTSAMSFVFVEDLDDPQEVIKAVAKAADGESLFCWDNFDEDLDSGGRDNFTLSVTGSFSVLKKAKELSARHVVQGQCRGAVLQAFSLMLADARTGFLLEQSIRLDLRQIPLQRIGPLSASWYGYQLQFRWTVPADLPY